MKCTCVRMCAPVRARTYVCVCVCVCVSTCSSAHAPGGQAVGRGEAVKHADVLRRQELHKLGILEHLPLAVEDGGRLVRDVDDAARVQRHRRRKDVLLGIAGGGEEDAMKLRVVDLL